MSCSQDPTKCRGQEILYQLPINIGRFFLEYCSDPSIFILYCDIFDNKFMYTGSHKNTAFRMFYMEVSHEHLRFSIGQDTCNIRNFLLNPKMTSKIEVSICSNKVDSCSDQSLTRNNFYFQRCM